jgi:predicted dehydrogenase
MSHRYLRSHRTVKRVVDSGVLGDVTLVAAQYLRPPHEMAPSLARTEHQVLWGMAVHHLDAIRYVLDREAVGVFARSFTSIGSDAPLGASFQALVELDGGTRVTYLATYESSGHGYFGAGQEYYERLTGTRATLHVFHRWLFLCEGRKPPRPIRRGRREATEERVLLGKLAAAVLDGVEPDCSGRDALGTVAITDACLRSIDLGTWIDPRTLR